MSKVQTEADISTWREVPPYDAKARNDHAEAHCRTWQHGRHIDTLPGEPKQSPLTHPLEVYAESNPFPWGMFATALNFLPCLPTLVLSPAHKIVMWRMLVACDVAKIGAPLTMDELARLMRLYAEIDDD